MTSPSNNKQPLMIHPSHCHHINHGKDFPRQFTLLQFPPFEPRNWPETLTKYHDLFGESIAYNYEVPAVDDFPWSLILGVIQKVSRELSPNAETESKNVGMASHFLPRHSKQDRGHSFSSVQNTHEFGFSKLLQKSDSASSAPGANSELARGITPEKESASFVEIATEFREAVGAKWTDYGNGYEATEASAVAPRS
jgi:hypothetical protein